MRYKPNSFEKGFLLTCLICLFATLCLNAQRGGGGGGFGGGGFGGGGFGGGGFGGGGRGGIGASSTTGRTYPSAGDVGEAMISADPEGRRLIVVTDEDTAAHISQVVTNLDRPKPQVLIKVVFLEVTYNNSSDIGIEGGIQGNVDSSKGITGTAANAFGASSLGSAVGGATNLFGQGVQNFGQVPPGAGLYQMFAKDWQVSMRAIAQAGKTEVLSRPSILTRNNQPATITVGQSVPLVTNVRFDNFGNAINTISYQSVGIILRVTPFITSDGKVEMIVSPEISTLVDKSEWVPISGNGALAPVIATRSADTVVVTPDGVPVIIGGLMQNNKTSSDSKVPVLGDIPLLGMAFKRKVKANVKTELMIFLTPHIVAEPSQLAAMSAKERSSNQIVPKAFTEEELNRYIDGMPLKAPAPMNNGSEPSKAVTSPKGKTKK